MSLIEAKACQRESRTQFPRRRRLGVGQCQRPEQSRLGERPIGRGPREFKFGAAAQKIGDVDGIITALRVETREHGVDQGDALLDLADLCERFRQCPGRARREDDMLLGLKRCECFTQEFAPPEGSPEAAISSP